MPLTLAKETMDMNWKDTAASGSSQILLEGDMIVPDSKPDLQEILRCQGNVKIREKRVTDDRISFSGDLEISVLYRAKNGERPLYAMQASLPLFYISTVWKRIWKPPSTLPRSIWTARLSMIEKSA